MRQRRFTSDFRELFRAFQRVYFFSPRDHTIDNVVSEFRLNHEALWARAQCFQRLGLYPPRQSAPGTEGMEERNANDSHITVGARYSMSARVLRA